jgi:hypothetical protein
VLHKRTFAQWFGLGLKKLAFFVAQLGWQIEMNGNRFVHVPLACSFGKILSCPPFGESIKNRGVFFSHRTEAAEDSDGSVAGRRGTSKFPAVSCVAA